MVETGHAPSLQNKFFGSGLPVYDLALEKLIYRDERC